MKSKKTTKDKKELSQEDLERLQILQEAEEVKGEQLNLDIEGNLQKEDIMKRLTASLQNIDDPEKKYDQYYNILNKLLKSKLPKGKENENIRRKIYDEKNIILNRGVKKDSRGIRGSDGRMGYLSDIEIAIDIVVEWVANNGTAVDLFRAFYDKNEELGYPHQD